jgi:uncharacterized protein YkwD
MKKRYGIVIMLAALAALLLMSIPAAAPAATSLNPYEKQLISLINKQRAKRHLAALRINPKLMASSRAHSAEMASCKYFAHESANGEAFSVRIVNHGYSRAGYRTWKTGENLYWGAGLYSSPYLVVQGWMKSPSHRQVILTKTFRDIGVGAIVAEDGYGDCSGPVWFFTLDAGRRSK